MRLSLLTGSCPSWCNLTYLLFITLLCKSRGKLIKVEKRKLQVAFLTCIFHCFAIFIFVSTDAVEFDLFWRIIVLADLLTVECNGRCNFVLFWRPVDWYTLLNRNWNLFAHCGRLVLLYSKDAPFPSCGILYSFQFKHTLRQLAFLLAYCHPASSFSFSTLGALFSFNSSPWAVMYLERLAPSVFCSAQSVVISFAQFLSQLFEICCRTTPVCVFYCLLVRTSQRGKCWSE